MAAYVAGWLRGSLALRLDNYLAGLRLAGYEADLPTGDGWVAGLLCGGWLATLLSGFAAH